MRGPEVSFRLNTLLDFFYLLASRDPRGFEGVGRLLERLPECPADVAPELFAWKDIEDYPDLVRAAGTESQGNEAWRCLAQILRDSEPLYQEFLVGWRKELEPAARHALERWREDFCSRQPLDCIQRLLRKPYPYEALTIYSAPLNPTMSYSPGHGEIFCGSRNRADGSLAVNAGIALFIGHEVCHILLEESAPPFSNHPRFAQLMRRWQQEYPTLECPWSGIPEECCHVVMNRVAADTGEMAAAEMRKMMPAGPWADCPLYDVLQRRWHDFQENACRWPTINEFLIDCAFECLSMGEPSERADNNGLHRRNPSSEV